MNALEYQSPLPGESRRQRYMRLHSELDDEYQGRGWRARQEEAIRFAQPHRGRFNDDEQNRGERKDQEIVNDTAIDSWKKLSAAMFVGIPNPTRKWYGFTTGNPNEAEEDGAREYLDLSQQLVSRLLLRSFYKAIQEVIDDEIGPGTGVLYWEPHPKEIIRYFHFMVGSYRVATDAFGVPNVLTRKFGMTTSQMVREFGYDACSVKVQEEWNQQKFNVWHQVLHVIEERLDRPAGARDSKSKPWSSCWTEWATATAQGMLEDKFLRESGFDLRPFAVGRWSVNEGDAYASDSPTLQAIGDIRALQSLEFGGATTLAMLNDPALGVPCDLANASILPGKRVQLPSNEAREIKPIYVPPAEAVTVNVSVQERHEQRIRRAYMSDFLTLFAYDERSTPATAEEIRAKKEERLLLLGGVVLRLTAEVFDAAINAALYYGQKAGVIPRPPQGLSSVRVEYLNNFAIAQKVQGVSSADQWVDSAVARSVEAQRPDWLDSVDFDEYLRGTADMRNVPPKMVRTAAAIAKLRTQRQQQQAAQTNADSAAKSAGAIKDLSAADPEKLQELYQQLGPAASALAQGQG